ncbi:class I SAM-dependent methyltransferase [Chitinivorax sp. PXF-14]|uniref:class I SAM-dependent methyltransferase n=1 Tax=Chitinivorax sp. PXF-14 TaxID=3230488 RepID=UPI003467B565
MSFKDHFSASAGGYAAYRPHYPAALFEWLAAQPATRELAWDCATGNGQAAVGLAPHFTTVHATDASREQLDHAEPRSNIRYCCEPAEHTSLPDASVDLLTVAQALHWFDIERFFAEAQRVLKPGGVIAAWCYEQFATDGPLDAVLAEFYHDIVGPYWPPERQLLEQGYRTLPWPFEPLTAPPLALEVTWPLSSLTGYLRTWSASKHYQEAMGQDPVALIEPRLAVLWGAPELARRIVWPLSLRVGRKQ